MKPLTSAFTITELLIAIGVIAVLAALLIPASQLVRASTMKATCQSNQRQMIMGILSYTSENKGYVPASDWVAGGDWNSATGVGVPLTPGPLFTFMNGGMSDRFVPPIPRYMAALQNSNAMSQAVDMMARLPITMCPAVRNVFETQDVVGANLGSGNLQNLRPNYISSRNGPPNISVNGGKSLNHSMTRSKLETAMYYAKYSKLSQIERLSACGFIFCSNFRLDRLGVDIPHVTANLALSPMPIHLPRKLPVYGTTGFGVSFSVTEPANFRGTINVAYLDGHVAGLGYAYQSGTMLSVGGGDHLLPGQVSGNPSGSPVSVFLYGGN